LLKILLLCLPNLMVNSFGIIGYLLTLNFIVFWGVAPLSLVDYRRVLVE